MIALFAGVALLAFPYIGLEYAVTIGERTLNIPLADLAVLALLPLVALSWRRATRIPLPGWPGWVLLVGAGAIAAGTAADDTGGSLYTLLRKPVFLYLAWGGGFAWVVARELSPRGIRVGLEISATLASLVLIWSSVGRIESGNSLWWSAITGITNNHKTLAVALAPTIPLLLGLRPPGDRRTLLVVGLVVVGLLLSVSRTSWITAAVAACWFVSFRGRLLAERRGLALGLVVVGILGSLYGPLLTGSLAQLDAARSRHSLDKRAWAMFTEHPLFGAGPGTSVTHIAHTFPDYRVNGVDAHGAIQKVASEYGLVGLFGWLLTTTTIGWVLHTRAGAGGRLDRAIWVCFLALHVNLLLSTETFSQTHWAMIALCWGLSWRTRGRVA